MELMQNSWNRFVHGDDSALGELYAVLFEPLVFTAYFYVKNMDVARDIVGDLFVNVLETEKNARIMKWPHITSYQAYLKTAVKNRSIDYLRKSKLAYSLRIYESASKIEDPFVTECLTILSEKEEILFKMHLDGYKNEEIAMATDLSEKTVRNKLSISRKKMITYFKSILLLWI